MNSPEEQVFATPDRLAELWGATNARIKQTEDSIQDEVFKALSDIDPNSYQISVEQIMHQMVYNYDEASDPEKDLPEGLMNALKWTLGMFMGQTGAIVYEKLSQAFWHTRMGLPGALIVVHNNIQEWSIKFVDELPEVGAEKTIYYTKFVNLAECVRDEYTNPYAIYVWLPERTSTYTIPKWKYLDELTEEELEEVPEDEIQTTDSGREYWEWEEEVTRVTPAEWFLTGVMNLDFSDFVIGDAKPMNPITPSEEEEEPGEGTEGDEEIDGPGDNETESNGTGENTVEE